LCGIFNAIAQNAVKELIPYLSRLKVIFHEVCYSIDELNLYKLAKIMAKNPTAVAFWCLILKEVGRVDANIIKPCIHYHHFFYTDSLSLKLRRCGRAETNGW
jgi:hypothetical protein